MYSSVFFVAVINEIVLLMSFSDSSLYFYVTYKVGVFCLMNRCLCDIYVKNGSFCMLTFHLKTCLNLLVPTALRWSFQGFLYQDHGIWDSDSLSRFQFRWCISWQVALARTIALCEFVVNFYHEWVLDFVECVSAIMIMYFFSVILSMWYITLTKS